EFQDSRLPTLKFADVDAEELTAVLESPECGFTVRTLTSDRGRRDGKDRPTAANVRKALAALVADKSSNDLLLVAISSHGVQFALTDKDGKEHDVPYFCPTDANFKAVNDKTGRTNHLINLNHLLGELGSSAAGFKLALLDVCRNDVRAEDREEQS